MNTTSSFPNEPVNRPVEQGIVVTLTYISKEDIAFAETVDEAATVIDAFVETLWSSLACELASCWLLDAVWGARTPGIRPTEENRKGSACRAMTSLHCP